MAGKYYKSKVNRLPSAGLGDLNFLGKKTEITREEVTGILNDFFDNSTAENSQAMKATAWEYIERGEDITLSDICISTKL